MENFDFSKKGAKVLVLSCIDPRYTELLADFLIHNKEVHNDYDLFNLAGAELGVLEKKNWKKVYYDHIDIALKLHKIKDLWIFSHMDCGMYKVSLGLKHDHDIDLHVKYLNKLEKKLKKDYPKLNIKKYVMTDAPEILEVVKS
jgi:carbonic anhydrase